DSRKSVIGHLHLPDRPLTDDWYRKHDQRLQHTTGRRPSIRRNAEVRLRSRQDELRDTQQTPCLPQFVLGFIAHALFPRRGGRGSEHCWVAEWVVRGTARRIRQPTPHGLKRFVVSKDGHQQEAIDERLVRVESQRLTARQRTGP